MVFALTFATLETVNRLGRFRDAWNRNSLATWCWGGTRKTRFFPFPPFPPPCPPRAEQLAS